MTPIMDRVLLRKMEAKQSGTIVTPDQYKESNEYEVVALGNFVIFGGQKFSLEEFVRVGDRVLVGQYNIEQVEVDGEKLYLTRIQDVRAREPKKNVEARRSRTVAMSA